MEPQGTLELFTKDNTSGEYVQYTPPTFRDQLPEDLRENEHLAKVDDAGTLAKSYLELKSSQPVTPETPDAYQLPQLPADTPLDEAAVGEFKKLAHDLKIPQAAFNKIVEFDVNRLKQAQTAYEQQQTTAKADLQKSWGANYDANMATVTKAIKGFTTEDQFTKLKLAGFMDDPTVAEVFLGIGKAISEDKFVKKIDSSPGDIPRGADGKPILDYPSMRKK